MSSVALAKKKRTQEFLRIEKSGKIKKWEKKKKEKYIIGILRPEKKEVNNGDGK
jgi:hypothetical protein